MNKEFKGGSNPFRNKESQYQKDQILIASLEAKRKNKADKLKAKKLAKKIVEDTKFSRFTFSGTSKGEKK